MVFEIYAICPLMELMNMMNKTSRLMKTYNLSFSNIKPMAENMILNIGVAISSIMPNWMIDLLRKVRIPCMMPFILVKSGMPVNLLWLGLSPPWWYR